MATSFHRSAWTFPAAHAAHVAAEAPGFTAWARRNASARYTQQDFVGNNALGFVATFAATVAITHSERRSALSRVLHARRDPAGDLQRPLSRGHHPRLSRVLARRGHLHADAAFVVAPDSRGAGRGPARSA